VINWNWHFCQVSVCLTNSLKPFKMPDKKLKCYFCKKNFRSFQQLSYHMRSHTKESPRKCQICVDEKQFKISSHYYYHMRKHDKDNSQVPYVQTFRCKLCKIVLASAKDLSVHRFIMSAKQIEFPIRNSTNQYSPQQKNSWLESKPICKCTRGFD